MIGIRAKCDQLSLRYLWGWHLSKILQRFDCMAEERAGEMAWRVRDLPCKHGA